MSEMTIDEFAALRGAPVYDSAGDKIGQVEEVFYDEQTTQPEWIGIGTGFFGTKRVLVPVAGASAGSDGVTGPHDKAHVKGSPDVDSDEISQELEAELYEYYGLERSERTSDTGLPEGRRESASEQSDETSVLRSEEELAVGKREVEAGRARIRKWVETEPVQADVALRRETAHVVREPVEQRVSGAEIGEGEVEVQLRREEAVVSKQTVAKERVALETDVDVERRTISEEVRKERVEVDEDTR